MDNPNGLPLSVIDGYIGPTAWVLRCLFNGMGSPEPQVVEQANVRFHAFLFIGQAYWKWRLQAHLVIHTLGFYNIKSGSGIYKAVTDRPIDY